MLLSGLTVVLALLYTLIAGFALVMTFAERARTGQKNPFYTALSVLACAAWPVTLMIVAITAQLYPRPATPAHATAKVRVAG